MRYGYIGGAVLAAAVAVAGPSRAAAQDGQFQPPGNSGDFMGSPVPIPTGRTGDAGFYTSGEFLIWRTTKAIGRQTIGVRGFYDTQGTITGLPGTFVGSGEEALNARAGGGNEYMPGWRAEVGYKFDTGVRIYANYAQLYSAHYSSGATLNRGPFRSRPDLADTFVSSPVYNFTNLFNGPDQDTNFDGGVISTIRLVNGVPQVVFTTNGNNTAGLWNAAEEMTTKFTQRYSQAELGMRTPLFSTEHSSVYGLGGARFAWFFERFYWRTLDRDQFANEAPNFAADYTNTLSQRMYGLFAGCGHEIYLGNMFSLSGDLTGAAFLNVVKGRAKYKLADQSTQSKYGRDTVTIVPSATAEVNLWMYPTEGVQLRIGYSALTFFNTRYMREPVGFNFSDINPNYDTKYFRLIHGFNVGIGFFF